MSNMRGLDTQVRAIRRRVFKEVAKLGFEANSETLLEDMEAIPYEIVNDDTVKYRESTYRSRAIVRERLRLAMGLSLRPEDKPVHLTAGVQESNISEKYYEPPLMQVIPSACESCEENKYEVSNMCKGCLAHPCSEVCPKGAISMVNGKSYIDQEKCIKCGNVRQSVRMMRSRKKSAHVKMPVVWEQLFLTNTAVPILTQKNVCPAECVW